MRQPAGVDVQAAQLGAAMELRKDLAGVEEPVRVERAFEALLVGEVDFVEHRPHQVALFDPDPMLAGENPADRDAEPQDIGAERLGPLDLAGLVGVIKNERVQVGSSRVDLQACKLEYSIVSPK